MTLLPALLKQRLKPARFEHTRGVARTAARLARRHRVSVPKAELAAWLHDCAKGLERGEVKKLLSKAGADKDELSRPGLWHAPVGAWLARHEYGVRDREVLAAIRFHSTGSPRPGRLLKLLFVADYIEPGRRWPELQTLRPLANRNLDEAYLEVLRHKLMDLLKTRRPLHPRSLAAYAGALKSFR